MLTGGPLVAHCWVPFMVVLWRRNQLIGSGPPVDHLHQQTTQRACRRWPNIGISVGSTLAATVGPVAFLLWV